MKTYENTHSLRIILPLPLVLALVGGSVTHADPAGGRIPSSVEVFTTADFPITGHADSSLRNAGTFDLYIYELDGIQRIEAKLSKDLSADPEQSKQVVLQRFQQLRQQDRTRMQRAAMGLANAMQYGVDRYPAIVFDGQGVVYGITDVQTALAYYRAWRREGKR